MSDLGSEKLHVGGPIQNKNSRTKNFRSVLVHVQQYMHALDPFVIWIRLRWMSVGIRKAFSEFLHVLDRYITGFLYRCQSHHDRDLLQ